MSRRLRFCILFIGITCTGFSQKYPTTIVVDSSSSKAFMLDMSGRYLMNLNLSTGGIKKYRLDDSLLFQNFKPALFLYNDFLLVHGYGGVDLYKTYLLTQKGVVSSVFKRNLVPDRSGKNLYNVDQFGIYPFDASTWSIQFDKKVEFEKLPVKKGNYFDEVLGDFTRFSEDGNRVAILQKKMMPKKNEFGINRASVYDTKTGKLLCSFEGTEEDTKNEFKYMDLSADGKFLILGNKYRAILYDVDNQKKKGTFDENKKNDREEFTNVAFLPHSSSLALLCSKNKIYTLSVFAKDFDTAVENVYFGGETSTKVQTTYIFDEFNAAKNVVSTSTYTNLSKEYYWDNFCFSSDNKYVFGLIRVQQENSFDYSPHINKYLIRDPSKHTLYQLKLN